MPAEFTVLTMRFALFDLDHTLLEGDTDELWGRFLVDLGLLPAEEWSRERARHAAAYRAGSLDIDAFLAYALRPLMDLPMNRIMTLRDRFFEERLAPSLRPAARRLVQRHLAAGDAVVIATATNRLLTEPLVWELGAEALIATDPEVDRGRLTGRISGEACFREGKLKRVLGWLGDPALLARTTFYSDSHNDLPLLEAVDRPVAVDPDPELAGRARAAGWPVVSLREPAPA